MLFFNKNFKAMKKKILVLLSFLTPVLLVLFFSLQPVKEAKANEPKPTEYEFDTYRKGEDWICVCYSIAGTGCFSPNSVWWCGYELQP